MSKRNIYRGAIIIIVVICILSFAYFRNIYLVNQASKESYEGVHSYYSKDVPNAKLHFQKAIEFNKSRAATIISYTMLGKIYIEEGNYDNAIRTLTKAVEVAPDKTSPHHLLGVAYYNKGFLDKAKQELEISLTIYPKAVDSHYYLGLIYLKQNNKNLALKEFEAEIVNGENTKASEMINKIKNESH